MKPKLLLPFAGTAATLVAAALTANIVACGGLDEDTYFEVAAAITTLILLGRYLEARAKRRSGAAIRELLELGAKDARVLRDGEETLVPLSELQAGDRFVVRPGEKIATDGVVEEAGLLVYLAPLMSAPTVVGVQVEDRCGRVGGESFGYLGP